jgi:hypothetical protein
MPAVALLSERLVRLKGAAVNFTAPTSAMPVAVGALRVLMTGYKAVQWAVGGGIKDGWCTWISRGRGLSCPECAPTRRISPDLDGVAFLGALLEDGGWSGMGTA